MILIGAIKHLFTYRRALDKTQAGKSLQFALQRACANISKLTRDLPVEEGLIGMAKQKG
jgi:hypothetical protein